MTRETVSRNRGPEPTDGPHPRQDEPSRKRSARRAAILVVLVMLLFTAAAWALVATFVTDDESGGPEVGMSLDEVTSDPEALYGSTVVVSGEITDVVGDEEVTARTRGATAFVIGAGGQRLLVVGAQIPQLAALEDDEALAEGDIVQVTGTVRDFDMPALEEDLGTELGHDDFETVDDLPVLLASAVNPIPTSPRQ